MDEGFLEIRSAIQQDLSDKPFDLAIILGSGLGSLADQVEDATFWPYDAFTCFPPVSVAGHKGRLIVGTLFGWRVLIFQGRHHLYEGYNAREVSINVRLASILGCRRLLLTNAVGGINEGYRAGDFMYVADHINMMGDNPLRGMSQNPFIDLSCLYQQSFFPALSELAKKEQIQLHHGILCAVQGPSYETPAEIRAFKILGADVVSMSTVPEAIMAKYLSMEVVGLSFVSNVAAGLSLSPLHHDDVLNAGRCAESQFCLLVRHLIRLWQSAGTSAKPHPGVTD